MIGLIFIDSQKGNDILKKIRQKTGICFDLIYHSEKKRENSNRGKLCPPRFVKEIFQSYKFSSNCGFLYPILTLERIYK